MRCGTHIQNYLTIEYCFKLLCAFVCEAAIMYQLRPCFVRAYTHAQSIRDSYIWRRLNRSANVEGFLGMNDSAVFTQTNCAVQQESTVIDCPLVRTPRQAHQ